MSKAKFEAALELIQEKKFDEARAILRTIDQPKAIEWIGKIDQIDPPKTPPVTVNPAKAPQAQIVAETKARLLCPHCEQQSDFVITVQTLAAGSGNYICPSCNQPFRTEIATVRAKRSQGDKEWNKRHFSIRVKEPSGRERMIDFSRWGYADFELRSGDLSVYTYIENQLCLVQNLTTRQYMWVKKPRKPMTRGRAIATFIIYFGCLLFLVLVLLSLARH